MKIHPVMAELFMRTDRRTDRHDEANNSFAQICESTKKVVPMLV